MSEEGPEEGYTPGLEVDGHIFFDMYDACARKLYPEVQEKGYLQALKTCVSGQMALMKDFVAGESLPSFDIATTVAEYKQTEEEGAEDEDE